LERGTHISFSLSEETMVGDICEATRERREEILAEELSLCLTDISGKQDGNGSTNNSDVADGCTISSRERFISELETIHTTASGNHRMW
jgi:hypothetical protein